MHLVPLRRVNSEVVTRELYKLFCQFGFIETLSSDNASYFTSSASKQFFFGLGVKHVRSSAYFASGNPVEKYVQLTKNSLKAYLDGQQQNWLSHVFEIQHAVNTAVHTELKVSPFRLYFGREETDILLTKWEITSDDLGDRSDVKVWESAYANMAKAWEERRRLFLRKRNPVTFRVGDLVMVRAQTKSSLADRVCASLADRFHGPYEIISFRTPNTVLVRNMDGKEIISHVSLIKRYVARRDGN